MRWILIVGLSLLVGCRSGGFRVQVGRPGQGPVAQPVSQPQPQPSRPTNLRASGSATNMLAQIDQLMRSNGWNAVGPVVRNTLAPNAVTAYSITATPTQCYAVFGLAEEPRNDLNLWITGVDQRVVESDMRTDGHPWAVFCPPYGGNNVVRLNMRGASGPFYFVAYAGPRNRMPDVATFYSGAQSQGQDAVAQLDAAAQVRLTTRERSLQSQGYQRSGDPILSTLNERGERSVPLQLQQGYCYAFAATSNATINDADLSLVDGTGARLTQDVDPAADAFVEHCPDENGQAQVRIRVARGHGTVSLTAYARPNARAQASAQPSAPIAPITSTSSVESNALDERFTLADSEMRARGYETYNDRNETDVPANTARETRIQLEGGKCYAVIGVGDDDIANLDLSIRDASNQTLDSDTEPNARPVVRVCPETTGQYTLRVIATQGQGRIAVQAYKWPRGTRGAFGLRGVMYLRLAEMMALLATEGYEPDDAYTPERGVLTANNPMGTHQLSLAGGQCYVVLAVGSERVTNLGLSLVVNNATVGADRTSNPLPMVYRCATTDEQLTAQTRAEAGSGDYFLQLFKRTAQQ